MEADPTDTAGSLEFRVLGDVEVVVNGRPLALGGRKSRELLAFLLLHGNETVSQTRIVEALWGDDAPLTVEASLRREIQAGDEETRRFMRVLHEDVIARIAAIGESRP